MKQSSADRPVYLVGSKANVITSLFLAHAKNQNIDLQGVIYVGRSANPIVMGAKLLLSGRLKALRAIFGAHFWTSVEAIDASDADDVALCEILQRLEGAIFVVCGCDRILRPMHLSKGIFLNYHNSLLPANRGVSAIKWAKYHGQPIGFSFHKIGPKIDSGKLLFQKALASDAKELRFTELSDLIAVQAAADLPHALAVAVSAEKPTLYPKKLKDSYNSRADTGQVVRLNASEENAEAVKRIIAAFEELQLVFDKETIILAPVYNARPRGLYGFFCCSLRVAGVNIFLPFWKFRPVIFRKFDLI